MSFGTAISTCLTRYADFSGRARRSEYWWFALFLFLVGVACAIVESSAGLTWGSTGWGPLSAIANLVFLVPSLAVGARRLHDTGKSGWWQLLLLIPCIGFIALIIMWCQDSERDDNKYGPVPVA